jgi:hypothetical protein
MTVRPPQAFAAAQNTPLLSHRRRQAYWYDPSTAFHSQFGALSPFIVPLTDGWKYLVHSTEPTGDTWDTQVARKSNFNTHYLANLVTYQADQAISILAPSTTFRMRLNVEDNDQFSVTDPAQFSVLLDDEVVHPGVHKVLETLSLITVTTSISGSHNLTITSGPQFKGRLAVDTFIHRTYVDVK